MVGAVVLTLGLRLLMVTAFFPGLTVAHNRAQEVLCMSHLARIGLELHAFEGLHNGYLPSGPLGGSTELQQWERMPIEWSTCPLDPESGRYIYIVDLVRELHRRKLNGETPSVPWNFAGGPGLFCEPGGNIADIQPVVKFKWVRDRAPVVWDRHPVHVGEHGAQIAVLFGNGEVEFLYPSYLDRLLNDPEQGELAAWALSIQDPGPYFEMDAHLPFRLEFGRGSELPGLDGAGMLDVVIVDQTGHVSLSRQPTRTGAEKYLATMNEHWATAELQLSPDLVAEIVSRINSERLIALDRHYTGNVADRAEWVFFVTQNGQQRVVYFHREFPAAITRFADALDDILKRGGIDHANWTPGGEDLSKNLWKRL